MKMHRSVCIGWLWFIIGVADLIAFLIWSCGGHLIWTNRNTHG